MPGKVLFSFIIEKKTQCVTVINGNELLRKLPFSEFFASYLSKDVFEIEEPDYNLVHILDFLRKAGKDDLLSFQSIDKVCYHFVILGTDGESAKMGIIRHDDNRGDIDFLTGVHSRSYLFTRIQEERNKGHNENAYLFRIDLDNFKQINDNYGHIVGDRCLQTIAEKLQAIFRDAIFGRYGGDEFLCYIKDCTETQVRDFINQILQVRFQYEKNYFSKRVVTCSVGCSFPVKDRKDIYVIIQEADSALYQSKHEGKNKGSIYLSSRTIDNGREQRAIRKRKAKPGTYSSSLFNEEIKHKKLKYTGLLGVFLSVFSILIIVLDVSFYARGKRQATEIAQTLAEEQSKSVAKETSSRVDLSFATLQNGTDTIKNVSYTGGRENYLKECLSSLKESGSILYPGVLLSNGDIFYGDGVFFNVANSTLCNSLILDEVSAVDVVSFLDEGDKIVLGYPCDITAGSNEQDRIEIKGVLSIFQPDQFSGLVFGDFLNGSAYLSLLKSNGNKICDIAPSGFTYFNDYHNLRNRFADDGLSDYLEAFRKGLESESGAIDYFSLTADSTGKAQDYYFFFSRRDESGDTRLNDWRIVIVIPYSLVDGYISGRKNYSRFSINILSLVFLLVFLLFFLYRTKLRIGNFVRMHTDSRTHLINVSRFITDATTLLNRPHSNYYLVYLNVQKFKSLNSIRGTKGAETVLVQIAQILEKRVNDDELVSREYSDHFVLFLKAGDDDKLKKRLTNRLSYLTDNCTLVKDSTLYLDAGVYHLTKQNEPVWLAVDRARKVCTNIQKDETNNVIDFFDLDRLEKSELEVYIEQSQESALTLGKFRVYYQGKYDLKENRINACEALVRWKDDRKGRMNTQFFIDVFEKNGFILKLDLYIFETVLKDIRQRRDKGEEIYPVSINLSRRHFEDPDFFSQYEEVRKKYKVPGKYIEFEITESIILTSQSNLNETIDRIHALGSFVSIDDFGSGFSNLSMLNRTNYDILKRDRNLLFGKNGFDDYSKNILKRVINLNKSLEKKVICEGVEHKEESDYLREVGCDRIQGYYYCKPMPKEEFLEKVEASGKEPK